jgi:GDP-D-mannose dehydratase
MLNKVREEKGITLVVLIITIIVLLCLAGVIVYLVFGQDGLTGKDNALEAERDKAYAKDIVTMALKVVEKEQEQSEMNVNGLVQTNTNPDVIDAVVKAIDKASNFKEGADGSSVEYVTNNGDKYVVTIDTQNLKVKDVN